MTGDPLSDAPLVLLPMRWLIAAWIILAKGQQLVRAGDYAPDGIIPWSLLAEQRLRPRLGRVRRRMTVGLLCALLVVQVLAAIVLAVVGISLVTIACLIVLIASNAALIVLNGEFWTFGDTKMGMVAMAGALLIAAGARSGDAGIVLAGVLVAGGQLVLCYAVAGLSKLATAAWRDGRYLQTTMASDDWGHPRAGRMVAYRPVAVAASWSVILLEALFPLSLLAPLPWLIAALGVMLLFHVATDIVMGLNLFPWAFATPYPAVVALWFALHAGG